MSDKKEINKEELDKVNGGLSVQNNSMIYDIEEIKCLSPGCQVSVFEDHGNSVVLIGQGTFNSYMPDLGYSFTINGQEYTVIPGTRSYLIGPAIASTTARFRF